MVSIFLKTAFLLIYIKYIKKFDKLIPSNLARLIYNLNFFCTAANNN